MKNGLSDNMRDIYFDRAKDRRGSESTHHFHDAHEIYYLEEGSMNYFIGEHSYEVRSGDVVIIPRGTIHRTNYGIRPHSRALINFPAEILPGVLAESLGEIGCLYRNPDTIDRVAEIFSKIEEEYCRADSLSADAIGCYISELLLLFVRNGGEYDRERRGKGPVDRAVRYIQENYMNEVRLSDLARLCSVSSEHLSRAFKKETGFCFNEYLTLIRLQKAEYMLKNEPGRAIGEIAYACGFNDSNYFSFKFKKLYGIPPIRAKGRP